MHFPLLRAHGPRVFALGAGLLWATAWEGRADAAPGSEALTQARQAWDDGEFDRAERSYEQAIQRGGLDKSATLECYVHLGAIRAVLGKKEAALSAYRTALFIDDGFTVPREAGKKAATLAEAARRQRNRIGMLHVQLSVPDEVASGGSFAVNVLMDVGQAVLVSRVALLVKDATTHKTWTHDEPAGAVVHFSVPASMTLPRASLHLQVDALDDHNNQLATDEAHTTVRATPVREDERVATHGHDQGESKGGGFWSSPWPYLLGGMVLAAGAATGVYFLLRPPDQVSIGPAQMQTY